MILRENLKEIVKAQKLEIESFECGVDREILDGIDVKVPFAIVISGIRRCGKSTVLRQLMKKTDGFNYLNFEDPRTTLFETTDFQKLDDVFKEVNDQNDYYFLDEIQNIEKWELFVRAMFDKKKHFVITGSNASLLSKELGTRLTGRHISYELFPFSYAEFLKFTEKNAGVNSFEEYLQKGGFPGYLKHGKDEILQELFNDILARDIVVRHKLRNSKTIKELALYLITNVGKEFSYNSLMKIFDLGSANSAVDYVSYLEDSYMLFTVPKFDYSIKKQLINPKKVYSIDNGLSRVNSVSFSSDKGRMLENQVFLELRRTKKEIYYFKENKECDFLVKEKNRITTAIQVCYDLNDDNKGREIDGLIETMDKFKLEEGFILTYDQEDEIKTGKGIIKIKPVWKWVMNLRDSQSTLT